MAFESNREKILEVGTALFRRYGFHKVTMRDISDTLGISVGNVTYHFKKKEDIIAEVIRIQHGEYMEECPDSMNTIEEMDVYFRYVADARLDNSQFYINFPWLLQFMPDSAEVLLSFVRDVFARFYSALGCLAANGLLAEDCGEREREALASAMTEAVLFWIPKQRVMVRILGRVRDLPETLWQMILPHMTQRGILAHAALPKRES